MSEMVQGLQAAPQREVTKSNIILSRELCKHVSDSREDFDTIPFQTPGHSPQDCITVVSAAHKYIVKSPHNHTRNGINAAKTEARWADWASQLGIAPKVLLVDDVTGSFITKFIQSQASIDRNSLQYIQMAIATLHMIHRQKLETCMQPATDPLMSVKRFVQDIEHKQLLNVEGTKVLKHALHISGSKLAHFEREMVPCHNDFHEENLLVDHEGKMWCIDYDSAGLGDPMWDVAYLAASMHHVDLRALAKEYGATREQMKKLSLVYCLSLAQKVVRYALNGSSALELRDDNISRLEDHLAGLDP